MRMIKPEDIEFDILVDEENMIIQAVVDVHDAVPVVRCKDCKWWEKLDYLDSVCRDLRFCTYVIGTEFVRKEYDYCSRGERKDDHETERP